MSWVLAPRSSVSWVRAPAGPKDKRQKTCVLSVLGARPQVLSVLGASSCWPPGPQCLGCELLLAHVLLNSRRLPRGVRSVMVRDGTGIRPVCQSPYCLALASALCSVLCALYSVLCALCSLLCALCSVLLALCSVLCTLCSALLARGSQQVSLLAVASRSPCSR